MYIRCSEDVLDKHEGAIYVTYVMHCAIWYHLHNSKNVKSNHEGVLLLFK